MSDLQCPARLVLVPALSEPAPEVDARLTPESEPLSQLEDLADLHRGETLVVAVPPEAVESLPQALRPGAGKPVHVELDADGWRLYVE